MIYSNHNYDFSSTNNVKDKSPKWMDDFFKKANKPTEKVNVASIFNDKPVEHYCTTCGTKLAATEVNKCSKCIGKNTSA